MKVVYDPEVDVLSVLLSDAPVAESDQDKPGVSLRRVSELTHRRPCSQYNTRS